jgi:hypothetical protein
MRKGPRKAAAARIDLAGHADQRVDPTVLEAQPADGRARGHVQEAGRFPVAIS